MVWTDPTDYAADAIPTTTGAESTNINTKLVAKITQLHNFLIGTDTETYILTATLGTDFKIKLGDSSAANNFQILASGGGTVLLIDSEGQLGSFGYMDATVIGAQFPGDSSVGTKINNVRILAPYTFKASELAMALDDTEGVGAGGTAAWRVVNSVAGTLGTVSVVPGSTQASVKITTKQITKDTVFTFDTVTIGGSGAPGRDINIQIRGYRVGTLLP